MKYVVKTSSLFKERMLVMKKSIILLSLVLFCTFKLSAQVDSFSVNGHMRRYLVHAPSSFSSQPLVLCLHGAKGNPEYQQDITQFNIIADRENFIVVYPDGHYTNNSSRNWDYSSDEDVMFLQTLIDTMYSRYKVDLSRIYCCGFSLGGMMTYRMACSLADRLAAIVSVSGPLRSSSCNPVRPIPVMHIHGLADNTINSSNAISTIETWRKIENCPEKSEIIDPYPASEPSSPVKYERWGPCDKNSEVILLLVDKCDHSWPTMENFGFNATEEIWRFFKKHSLDNTQVILPPYNTKKKLWQSAIESKARITLDAKEITIFNLYGVVVGRWNLRATNMQLVNPPITYLTKSNAILILQIISADGTISKQRLVYCPQ